MTGDGRRGPGFIRDLTPRRKSQRKGARSRGCRPDCHGQEDIRDGGGGLGDGARALGPVARLRPVAPKEYNHCRNFLSRLRWCSSACLARRGPGPIIIWRCCSVTGIRGGFTWCIPRSRRSWATGLIRGWPICRRSRTWRSSPWAGNGCCRPFRSARPTASSGWW